MLFIKQNNPLQINLLIHKIFASPCSIISYTDRLEGFCKNFLFVINKRNDNTIYNVVLYKN